MNRKIAAAVGLGFAALLAWLAVGAVKRPEEGPKAPAARPPVPVELAAVRRGPIREEQRLAGEVIPSYRFTIAARVPGRLLQITKRVGDPVAAGEIVARLDDGEHRQAVLEAEADLAVARAARNEAKVQLEQAARELERVRALEAKELISRAEVERARASHDALLSRQTLALAQTEQREAALSAARIRLGYSVLAATQPGLIAERFADEGSLLAANAPVLAVIGIDPAVVRATLTERLSARVAAGQPAAVEVDAYPEKTFPGRVARIAPALKEETRTAEMEVELANPSLLLKPGMFARVRIVLDERSDAQLIPTAALVSRDGESGVFVVDAQGTTAAWRAVTVGFATPELTEVVSPELAGNVVTLGQHLLENGNRVTVPQPSPRLRE